MAPPFALSPESVPNEGSLRMPAFVPLKCIPQIFTSCASFRGLQPSALDHQVPRRTIIKQHMPQAGRHFAYSPGSFSH